MLTTVALRSGYSGMSVLHDVSMTVEAGEVVALLGPNGAGKTTTLATIAGALRPMSGRVVLDGTPLRGPVHRRIQRGIGYVTEQRAVIRRLDVAANLRLGTNDIDAALDLFPELRPLLRRKAGLLSGGEQQMLALARVLAERPRLLLVDELSFGLAPQVVRRLLVVLRAAADAGAAVLLVEQHPATALEFADRGYVLRSGEIILTGTADELRASETGLLDAYLGTSGGRSE